MKKTISLLLTITFILCITTSCGPSKAVTGVDAVIARARQLTDFKWTPLNDVPIYISDTRTIILKAGVEVTGFPYSSTELNDKFFTENVSFETFLTCIPNPLSIIYQEGSGEYGSCNYGIVCNGLVRYALGIPYRISTKCWETVPGMNVVKPHGEYTADEIQLCDVLYAYGEGRNHVALMTNLSYDSDGKVTEIEVSEATRPTCKRQSYKVDEFFEKYKLFALWRYDKLDEVPPLDKKIDKLLWESDLEKTTPKITVDYGNKSNYLVGDSVMFSINSDRDDTVELFFNEKLVKKIPVQKNENFSLELPRGYYVAKLKKAKESVEFCVNKASVSYEVKDGIITITADPCDENSEIHYMDFRVGTYTVGPLSKFEILTQKEKDTGVFSREIPEDGESFKVYYKNKYGVWTHRMTAINAY